MGYTSSASSAFVRGERNICSQSSISAVDIGQEYSRSTGQGPRPLRGQGKGRETLCKVVMCSVPDRNSRLGLE